MVRYRSKVKKGSSSLKNEQITPSAKGQSDQYKNPNSHKGITFFDPTSILSIA
jgi:hypothetical protein